MPIDRKLNWLGRPLLSLIAALATALLHGEAGAAEPEPLDWRVMQEACGRADSPPQECEVDAADIAKVKAFCALKSNLDGTAWSSAVVPEARVIRTLRLSDKCKPAAIGHLGGAAGQKGTQAFKLDQSAILWGATDFLLQRAQRELNVWLLDRLVAEVCGPSSGERIGGADLLPKTCEALRQAISGDLAQTVSAMRNLQDVARDEMPLAPYAVLAWKTKTTDGATGDAAKAQKDLLGLMTLGAYSAGQVVLGSSLVQSLRDIAISDARTAGLSCTETAQSARLFQLSALLRAYPVVNGQIVFWEDSPVGRKGLEDSLPLAMLAMVVNGTGTRNERWPAGCAPAAWDVQRPFIGFDPASLAAFVTTVFVDIIDLISKDAAASRRTVSDLVRLSTAGLNFALQLRGPTLSEEQRRRIEELGPVIATVARGDFSAVPGALLAYVSVAGWKDNLPGSLGRLLALSADVALAQDAEAVSATLDRLAAPVGSSRAKRVARRMHVGLNGYVGLLAAAELAKQSDNLWENAKWSTAYGLSLPVGLELGTSCGGWSIGVLAQIVDLGTLASWRIRGEGDQTSSPPEVGFKQVFAPGAFLALGLPSAPLSVLLGGDVAPSLRAIGEGPTKLERDVLRLSARLALDIPIFP